MKILLILLLLATNLYPITITGLRELATKKFKNIEVKVYYMGSCTQNGYDKETGHVWIVCKYEGIFLMSSSSFKTKVKDRYHIYKVVKGQKELWYAFKYKLKGKHH